MIQNCLKTFVVINLVIMAVFKALICISCFAVYALSKTTVMVVLGCAVHAIQQERLSTAVEYVNNLDDSEVVWFLTGGVKNAISSAIPESQQMKNDIVSTKAGKIVLDDKAQNTAENFAYLKKWLLETYKEMPDIVITTSEFHKERASRIFGGVFQNMKTEPLWNLSESNHCVNCWNDEKLHMRNVESDVRRALNVVL